MIQDPDEIKKFYSTGWTPQAVSKSFFPPRRWLADAASRASGHGDMYRIRRSEARAAQKTLTPTRPEESELLGGFGVMVFDGFCIMLALFLFYSLFKMDDN